MIFNYDKIGTFSLSFEFIEDATPEYWSALMGEVVIVDAEIDMEHDKIIYTAISEKFSDLAEDIQVPRYIPGWNREEGRVVFTRI